MGSDLWMERQAIKWGQYLEAGHPDLARGETVIYEPGPSSFTREELLLLRGVAQLIEDSEQGHRLIGKINGFLEGTNV